MTSSVLVLRRFFAQVLLLLMIYFISRVAFTVINMHHFEGLGFWQFLRLSFLAIRYDLSAICAVNGLYFLLVLLVMPFGQNPLWERITQNVFVFSNTFALLFEISDWAYFPYNFKRATGDVLKLITTKGDFWSVLPDYLLKYWYIPLAAFAFIYFFIRINRKIVRATPLIFQGKKASLKSFWARHLILTIFVGGLTLMGIRGGIQYIPIGLRNAVQVTESRYVPIVLNTPFSIISTLTTPALEEVNFMNKEEATRLMPFHQDYQAKLLNKKNVVILIIESGSKEFTCLGGLQSYTPFLDSLMGKSLVCTQAFANGQTSAEGIPAILAGIPTLMNEAFTTSNYGTDHITALPSVLKTIGYQSAFFHGGTNGTMSFDIFSAAAGYDHYFGRSEYGKEQDYDGAWGIWDEPFLQYACEGFSKMKAPFFGSVFTLSSHPPYNLPNQYRYALPKGTLPVHQCIAYTDIALRNFFSSAAKQDWYSNTLFIITADHCSPQNSGGYYAQGLGQYAIPLIFFAPGDSLLHGLMNQPVQQLDILPSVLDYIGYEHPFFAFGTSIFDSAIQKNQIITYNNESYQWLHDGYLLQTNGIKPSGYFAYPADSLNRNNLLLEKETSQASALLHLKAFIQRYHDLLLHNSMQ